MIDHRIRFHEPHLQKVSRSFAFGISRLKGDLRASVGLAYLICRILDTIEDAQWTDQAQQQEAFDKFDTFMMRPSPPESSMWVQSFPKSINEGERALVGDAAKVFAEFHSLKPEEKRVMSAPIMSMSRGMREFALRSRTQGEPRPMLRLRDLTEVNTYCFFVAGVVGELLTGLIELDRPTDSRPIGLELNYENGIHFGLFLQKINVLKDQWQDEVENRYLVPDRAALLASLEANAKGAVAYLESIPLERLDYRMFCAWSLFLGLATVPILRGAEKPVGTEGAIAPRLSRFKATALGIRLELAIGNAARTATMANELLALAWATDKTACLPKAMRTEVDVTDAASIDAVSALLKECYSGRIQLGALRTLLIDQ